MQISHSIPRLTADEAAAVIPHGATVGFSAFTPSGAAKAVPRALAQRAKDLHAEGKPFKIRVLTGASTGPQIDKELAEANAIEWRAPYQSSKELRKRINEQETQFVDMHLSHVPQMIEVGFFGKVGGAGNAGVNATTDGGGDLAPRPGVS